MVITETLGFNPTIDLGWDKQNNWQRYKEPGKSLCRHLQ